MEEQKTEDQFDPDKIGEQLRQHMATVEGVLDKATADIAMMGDALVKFGFTAKTEAEADEHYEAMMTKISQASAQVAVLHGLLAFQKAMLEVPLSLHAMSAAWSALAGSMVKAATGKLNIQ